jgi:anti-sigma B factor antagonist
MMHFVEHKIDNVYVLIVKGNLVQKDDTDKLQDRLLNMMESGKAMHIVIDLKHVSIISSLGIGGVIRALRTVREKDGEMKLSSVNASVKKVFDITKLNELIEIHNTSDEAVKSFAV